MTKVDTIQSVESLPSPLGSGRIFVYLVFAWSVSVVCAFTTIVSAVSIFDIRPAVGFSIRMSVIGLVLAVMRYGAGAFILGSLIRDRVKHWTATLYYVTPFFLFHGSMFLSASVHDPIKAQMLANPFALIVIPIVYLALCPFVSMLFIRIGTETGMAFSKTNSALGVPWFHWLWILPFGLTQVIGVPLYLLLLLWKIDLLLAGIYPSILLNLPASISRIIVFFVLSGVLMLICLAHNALSDQSDRVGVRILKVIGAWLVLSVLQSLIVLSAIGKYMG